jgi:hypothetical protein
VAVYWDLCSLVGNYLLVVAAPLYGRRMHWVIHSAHTPDQHSLIIQFLNTGPYVLTYIRPARQRNRSFHLFILIKGWLFYLVKCTENLLSQGIS